MITLSNWGYTTDLQHNWNRLCEITNAVLSMSSAQSRDSVFDDLSKYMLLLEDLRHDRYIGETQLLGLYRAPASKNRHHNVEGGLVKHLLQMWTIWSFMRGMFREMDAQHPLLNDVNVWRCILHHDLNKVWKYTFTGSSDEWAVEYAKEEDRHTYMLGDVNKAIFLLGKHGITLSIPLLNALITSEGGFSEMARQQANKGLTVLAKYVYILDEMSANVFDRLQTNRFWDSKAGGISEVP